MGFRLHSLAGLLTAWLVILASPFSAFADDNHDRTQVGQSISIGPGETISEATCFGCSVRVRGQVTGDVTTFGGSIIVEGMGQIGGDATTFGGDIRLDKEVKVNGDVTVFGGRVRRDPAATVGGDINNMGGPGWIVLIFVIPLFFLGLFVALIVWLVRLLLRPAKPVAA